MKTEAEVSKHWDDLVFENRNKDYGAYEVRKSYSDRVIAALFIAMTTTAMVFAIPAVNSLFPDNDVAKPKLPSIGGEIEISVKPRILIEEKLKQISAAVKD